MIDETYEFVRKVVEREAAQAADILGDKPYRSRAALEQLLDAAQAADSPTTPWMVLANEVISDYSLGVDASAYILQIAAARDAAAAQAAAAQAAARADLLADMERRVIGCADDWEDYRYESWAAAADDTLAQATAATADADWLRAKAQEWDDSGRLMGSRRGGRTEYLLQRMDDYYYNDRSGHATWAWAAQAVLAEAGGIESWATQWLLGVAQDRDAEAAQAAAAQAGTADTADTRASLLSAAMVLVAAGGWWGQWADVGAAVLDAQADVPAADADWLRAEMAVWDAREGMMSIARRRPIIV